MPYADPDQRRAFMRERQRLWRAANPERAHANMQAQDKARRAWVRERKGSTCQRCGGEFPPRRLHFHHRDPATRSFTIGDGKVKTRSRVEAEIAKCDVLCNACHKGAHRELRNG